MSRYRDDRAALEERLEQLETAHHERLVARLPEQRALLEEQRLAVMHPPKSARKFWSGIVRFVALGVMLVVLRDEKGLASVGTALTIAAISLLFLVGWYSLDVYQSSQRHQRIAALDKALAALDAKKVRVALATELEAIQVRIAELESEEMEAETTPPLRTPRSAGTSR